MERAANHVPTHINGHPLFHLSPLPSFHLIHFQYTPLFVFYKVLEILIVATLHFFSWALSETLLKLRP